MSSLSTKNSKPVEHKVVGTKNKHLMNKSLGTTSILLFLDLEILVDYMASYILVASSEHISYIVGWPL